MGYTFFCCVKKWQKYLHNEKHALLCLQVRGGFLLLTAIIAERHLIFGSLNRRNNPIMNKIITIPRRKIYGQTDYDARNFREREDTGGGAVGG